MDLIGLVLNRFVASLRSHHSLYEPLLLVLLCLVVAAPLTEAIRREKKKASYQKQMYHAQVFL